MQINIERKGDAGESIDVWYSLTGLVGRICRSSYLHLSGEILLF